MFNDRFAELMEPKPRLKRLHRHQYLVVVVKYFHHYAWRILFQVSLVVKNIHLFEN